MLLLIQLLQIFKAICSAVLVNVNSDEEAHCRCMCNWQGHKYSAILECLTLSLTCRQTCSTVIIEQKQWLSTRLWSFIGNLVYFEFYR